MSSPRYPEHLGCGGPLLPAVALEGLADGEPLICGKCHQRSAGAPGDVQQATLANLAEGSAVLFAPPRRLGRRPGLRKAQRAPRAEQLELFTTRARAR